MSNPNRPSGEIRSLTGLRGVAAVFVVMFHALRSTSPTASFLLGKGYLSVDLFFVLSGYVMSLNYGEMFLADGASFKDYRKFLGFRFARIYPLYGVMICAMALLGWAGAIPIYGVHNLKHALIWNLSLMQAWSLGAGNIDGPAWSISTELTAYIGFPVLVFFVLRGKEGRAWGAAALALLLMIAIVIAGSLPIRGAPVDGPLGVFDTITPLPVFRCVAGFVLGMAAFRLQGSRFGKALASRPFYGDILAVALVILLFVKPGDVLFVALGTMLIAHLATSPSIVSAAISSRPVYYLGKISYSIYLIHLPIILLLRGLFESRGWPMVPANLFALALSIAIAPLAYNLVEVPGRMFLRRILSRLPTAAPAG